jgi:hypothetical protein
MNSRQRFGRATVVSATVIIYGAEALLKGSKSAVNLDN